MENRSNGGQRSGGSGGRRDSGGRGGFGGNRNSGGRGGFGGRSNNFDRGPREMHKATCSECGKECEVPFKPKEDRPVYCRDCFSKKQ